MVQYCEFDQILQQAILQVPIPILLDVLIIYMCIYMIYMYNYDFCVVVGIFEYYKFMINNYFVLCIYKYINCNTICYYIVICIYI